MAQTKEGDRPCVSGYSILRLRAHKLTLLCPRRTIAFTAIGATLTGSIFFPALESLQHDLHANDNLVAATVSVFIAGQGVFPSIWASLSEVTGRKYCCASCSRYRGNVRIADGIRGQTSLPC